MGRHITVVPNSAISVRSDTDDRRCWVVGTKRIVIMQIKIRAVIRQINIDKFTAAMHKEMEQIFVEAARQFLIEISRRIPVRTGFLRGAFSTLEDVVGNVENTGKPRSKKKTKATGVGKRPLRDTTAIAIRIAKLRDQQEKTLKRIKRLREAEQNRDPQRTKRELLERNVGTQRERKEFDRTLQKRLQNSAAKERARAIRQNNIRRKLLKRATEREAQIEKYIKSYETKAKIKLDRRLSDDRRVAQLELEKLIQRRQAAFQRYLKTLNNAHYGKVTTIKTLGKGTTVGKFNFRKLRVRQNATLSTEEYNRRVKALRAQVNKKNKSMLRIENKINTLDQQALSGVSKKSLIRLRKRLKERLEDQLEGADLERELNLRLVETIRKRNSRKSLNFGSDLLAQLSRRKALKNLRNQTFQKPRTNLRFKTTDTETDVRLNPVTRTNKGTIRGLGFSTNKFALRQGEEAVGKAFRLFEYYYPPVGGRVLKTPRSGRRFATPPSGIIQTQSSNSLLGQYRSSTQALFSELAKFRQAAGLSSPQLEPLIKANSKLPDKFQFNYRVDITYLQVAFASAWYAAISAFNRHIAINVLRRIPQLDKFTYDEIHELKGTTVSSTLSRR